MRAVAAALLLAACGGAQSQPVETVGDPVRYSGRVIASRGPTLARTGDTCSVEVVRASGRVLNCRIRVRCNGDLVYGLSDAGFNRCREVEDRLVFAHDHNGTRRDGDPRLFFDLDAGRLIVSDDGPDVEILVDLIARPDGYERRD